MINASSGWGTNYTRKSGSPNRGGMPATSYKAHGLICEAATIFEFLANVFICETLFV